MFKKVILSETSLSKRSQCLEIIVNVRIMSISVFANTKVSIGLCLSSMGVVFSQEDTSSLFKNTFFVHGKKVSALSFVYFNSWPVILTALPAVMVASRRCETRS